LFTIFFQVKETNSFSMPQPYSTDFNVELIPEYPGANQNVIAKIITYSFDRAYLLATLTDITDSFLVFPLILCMKFIALGYNSNMGKDRGTCRGICKEYKIRKAARAVVMHDDKIALMFVSRYNFHKLPGGGVKGKENIEIALKREVLEVVGCEISIISEIGMVREKRDRINRTYIRALLQESYCFLAELVGEIRQNHFTKEEKHSGFRLKWVTLDEANELVKNDKPKNYEGHFVQQRDLTLLQKADEILNQRC